MPSQRVFDSVHRSWAYPHRDGMHVPRACLDSTELLQRFQVHTKLKAHQGCVNTIRWNEAGTCILSGSDDQHLKITNAFTGAEVVGLRTGHRQNIFSAHFLPGWYDRRLVSCSGDGVIIYTDLLEEDSWLRNSFNCHFGTVYEITTLPGEAYNFFSCGEDGTVRWFDLRLKNKCTKEDCKDDVLIDAQRAVTTLATNRLVPYHVTCGVSDGSVRVYDRRMLGVGTASAGSSETSALKGLIYRFVAPAVKERNNRITSLQYDSSGYEVLVSYSSDFLYIFNTQVTEKAEKLFAKGASVAAKPETAEEGTSRQKSDSNGSASHYPFKRLRLRGDWSDTGPDSRPENVGARLPQTATEGTQGAGPSSSSELRVATGGGQEGADLGPAEGAAAGPDPEQESPGARRARNVGVIMNRMSTVLSRFLEHVAQARSAGGEGSVEDDTETESASPSQQEAAAAEDSQTPASSSSAGAPADRATTRAGQSHDSPERASQELESVVDAIPPEQLEDTIEPALASEIEGHTDKDQTQVASALASESTGSVAEGTAGPSAIKESGGTKASGSVQSKEQKTSSQNPFDANDEKHKEDAAMATASPPGPESSHSTPSTASPSTSGDSFHSCDETQSQAAASTPPTTAARPRPMADLLRASQQSSTDSSGSHSGESETEAASAGAGGMRVRKSSRASAHSSTSSPSSTSSSGSSRRRRGSGSPARAPSPPPSENQRKAAVRLQQFIRARQAERKRADEEMEKIQHPIVQRCFKGHRNSRTMIKEACFWGRRHVMSGSDCGRIFVWDRHTAELVQLLDGDRHVVNCLQPHPSFPILATSGIDYDVKLWYPEAMTAQFDAQRASEVIKRNDAMLEETRDTITVPASFMLRMLASLSRIRREREAPDNDNNSGNDTAGDAGDSDSSG